MRKKRGKEEKSELKKGKRKKPGEKVKKQSRQKVLLKFISSDGMFSILPSVSRDLDSVPSILGVVLNDIFDVVVPLGASDILH